MTTSGASEDGSAVLADGMISHWHLQSGRCLHEIDEKGTQTYTLDYTQDGATFASAGKDRIVRIYDEVLQPPYFHRVQELDMQATRLRAGRR